MPFHLQRLAALAQAECVVTAATPRGQRRAKGERLVSDSDSDESVSDSDNASESDGDDNASDEDNDADGGATTLRTDSVASSQTFGSASARHGPVRVMRSAASSSSSSSSHARGVQHGGGCGNQYDSDAHEPSETGDGAGAGLAGDDDAFWMRRLDRVLQRQVTTCAVFTRACPVVDVSC
jgi:hypothetical protein